jgi:DNA mismatch repair protein MutS
MEFITDKQTLEDLNLLGKFKSHSIFNIFNKVITRGGEKLLQEMFRQPLIDPVLINKRSAVFAFFQRRKLEFPFTYTQFSAMEDYLGGEGGANFTSVAFGVLKNKFLQFVVRDPQFEVLQKGLIMTLGNLQLARQFLKKLQSDRTENPCCNKTERLLDLLSYRQLSDMESAGDFEKLSLGQIIRYEHLLKVSLKDRFDEFLDVFHLFDVYMAVGEIAASSGFSYAHALGKEDNLLRINDFYHPGVGNAVPNTISFDHQSNMIFLTGANMAGKSTFMKALGINIYLAHMGFPVAANDMLFSVRDGLYTSINVFDNLNDGYSHFYAEVLRVKAVAQEVSRLKFLIVIFDELFKGTNVKDAHEATSAVIGAFSQYKRCVYVVSSHIIEAGEELKAHYPGIQFRYMPTILREAVTFYPYSLEDGISADRHGMMIIENEQIFELLK